MANMTINVDKAGKYILATQNKFVDKNIEITVPAGAATLEASGEAGKPTVEKGTETNILAGGATTTKPESGYYIAAKAKSGDIDLDITQKTFTEGYMKTGDISGSGSVDGVDGDEYYIPVTTSIIGVSATKPADTEGYIENKDAIVPSEGYLKIEEGYMPKTIISLATLIPDDATLGKTKDASTMRVGTTAYDIDGNLVVGTMETISLDNNFGAESTSEVTASETATDGYYTLTNSIAVSNTVEKAGYVDAKEYGETIEGATVGKIKEGKASGDVDGVIPAGNNYVIKPGYYPTEITVKAADSAGDIDREAITGSLNATADAEYTAPSFATEKEDGKKYVTFSGSGSMTPGNIFNGTVNAAEKYLEIFTGNYEVVTI